MRRIRVLTLPKLAPAIAALRIPLRTLEAASGTTASRELAAPESTRAAPVATAVRPRRVLGRRPSWRIRRRVPLAGVVMSLGTSGRSVIVLRICRWVLAAECELVGLSCTPKVNRKAYPWGENCCWLFQPRPLPPYGDWADGEP